jgi:hypothetical protein
MTTSQRLSQMRECFRRCVADDLGVNVPSVSIEREGILIKSEFFCGRRFHATNHRGVWFVEEDVLKVHRSDGTLVATYRGDEVLAMILSPASESPSILKMNRENTASPHVSDSIRRAA